MLGKRSRAEESEQSPAQGSTNTSSRNDEEPTGILEVIQREIVLNSTDPEKVDYTTFLKDLLTGLHVQRTLMLYQSGLNEKSPATQLANIAGKSLELVPRTKPQIRKLCMDFIIAYRLTMEEFLTRSTSISPTSMVFAESVLQNIVAEVCTGNFAQS